MIGVLPAHGFANVLYDVATQITYPSWGYMISRGATTLWERWGGYRYFDAGMNSLNHIMFGSIDEFFYGDIAGIRPASPGFKRISIKPHIVGDLKSAEASTKTVRGMVSSRWSKNKNTLTLHVSIPVNSRAEIHVPRIGLQGIVIEESGKTIWRNGSSDATVEGISRAAESDGYVTFEVGSGSYKFEMKGLLPD